MEKFKSVNEYINSTSGITKKMLKTIRSIVKKTVPSAEEKISYGMPAYKYNGRSLVYFAFFKNHIGFYPTPSAIKKFEKELSKYKTSKGAIQFTLDKALPINLIGKIIKFKVKENSKK